MRILFIYRHFWPDTPPYATMLRTIAAHLASVGHEVAVWSQLPSYGTAAHQTVPLCEVLDGVSVNRVGPLFRGCGGWLDRVLFPARMLLRALVRSLRGARYDLVVTATIPPVVNGLCARLAASLLRARFIYHCQDIYPELGAISGLWRRAGWRHRILLSLDRWTCGGAEHVVVPGEDMRTTLAARGLPRQRISVISNFMVEECHHLPVPQFAPEGPFQIVFAGNIGRFQALDNILLAAGELREDKAVEFLFLGDGTECNRLTGLARGLNNVTFAPHLPTARALPIIAAADLGIVSLLPGLIQVAHPSKTLTYLGLGVPVLALTERDSALAAMIEDERVGYVADISDATAIAGKIREAVAHRAGASEMRCRAKNLYARRFTKSAALARWEHLVDGVRA